jgi:hypothetical protein
MVLVPLCCAVPGRVWALVFEPPSSLCTLLIAAHLGAASDLECSRLATGPTPGNSRLGQQSPLLRNAALGGIRLQGASMAPLEGCLRRACAGVEARLTTDAIRPSGGLPVAICTCSSPLVPSRKPSTPVLQLLLNLQYLLRGHNGCTLPGAHDAG